MDLNESEIDPNSNDKSYKVTQAELDLLAYWISKRFANNIRILEGKEFLGLKSFLNQVALFVDKEDLEKFEKSCYLSWCEIKRRNIEKKDNICISNYTCSGCPEPNFDVRLIGIEENQGRWTATGEGWQKNGNIEYRQEFCPGCGSVYTKILQKIPILTKEFRCPTCMRGKGNNDLCYKEPICQRRSNR